MGTFIHDLANSIDEQWSEVEILISTAETENQKESPNNALYDALCRSAIVLMVAHFESFIKACVKAVIDDLNKFSSFKDLPERIKRTYCTHLTRSSDEKDTAHLNSRVKKIIEIFGDLNANIEATSFIVINEFGNDQKNPKPDIVEKVCKNFGIDNFFDQLSGSDLDIVFSDEKEQVEKLKEKLFEHLKSGVVDFPYSVDSSQFNITFSEREKKRTRTLWQEFLDEVNRQRHCIAHGTSFDNTAAPSSIRLMKDKLQVFQYAFILMVCENSVVKNDDLEAVRN